MSLVNRFLIACLVWTLSLFSQTIDYDVVVVGTSPFSLLEALYQNNIGKKVLIIEKASECGGSWKSISICGVPHADMGCHYIGSDPQILHFMTEYLGCQMVSLDNPLDSCRLHPSSSFYPSGGCYEFLGQILKLIEKTSIRLELNCSLEKVSIDPLQPIAYIETLEGKISTCKIIYPQYCYFQLADNPHSTPPPASSNFLHLYLLIADPTPPRFSYHSSLGKGISRMMNLTYFANLAETGQQLIVFQSYQPLTQQAAEDYLRLLIEHQLVDKSAHLLNFESYVYEQCHHRSPLFPQTPTNLALFESLDTRGIQLMSQYIPKWTTALKPYKEAMGE